jgi:hypothetical protein
VATSTRSGAYSVPNRFGIGALLAFMTLFAMILSVVRRADPAIWIYWYIGVLGLSVCLAQMLSGQQPRLISIAVGAVCLPLFMAIGFWDDVSSGPRLEQLVLGLPCLAVVGGVAGYLTGAMAAGVFLLGDMLVAKLRGNRVVTADLVEEPLSPDVPFYSPDSCTPYLGEAAKRAVQPSTMGEQSSPSDEQREKKQRPPEGVPVYNSRV